MSEPGGEVRPKRRLRRFLAGLGIAAGALAVFAALLYAFGTMQSPSADARAAYARAVAAGVEPAQGSRFGIPIPGCVCHGDDPVLQVQHSTRYIRECSNCHNR